MGNAVRLERRLSTIRYQLLKNYPDVASFSNSHKVRLVQKIYDHMIDSGVEFDDPSAFVDQALGVQLTWNVDGTSVDFKLENIEVSDDLIDQAIPSTGEPENAFYLDGEPWGVSGYGDGEFMEVVGY